ncbi:MFS transporter [Streptomyces platensis]|uniref:MFS transporter n=1 Tax=Streptomyces platensis TaxID=58346 RepID=UPI001F256A75|nr:MFS transporter [Streptomyces platensis]MCF3145198.1 MFS transporter [Streptomyces platensis]
MVGAVIPERGCEIIMAIRKRIPRSQPELPLRNGWDNDSEFAVSKWWALVAICLGTFMLLVDATIVNIALPDIAKSLNSSFTAFQWVVNIYALPLVALLLIGGSLADRFGRRALFVSALVVFGVASVLCGFAPSTGVLIAARALQGVGGAVMYATSTALIATSYKGRDMGMAFGVWAAVNGASAAAGPLLGGVLTEYVSWRAIFLINVPVAVVAVVLALKFIPESRNPAAGRFDFGGMITFTVAIAALTYAMTHSSNAGWSDGQTLGFLGLGVVALVAFVIVEARLHRPMLDLTVFKSASFVALMIGIAVMQGASFSRLPYTTVWLESALGLGPVAAGLLGSVPLSAATFVVALLTGRYLQHLAARIPIGIGLVLVAAGLFLQIGLDADSTGASLVAGLVVTGIGAGMINPVLTSAAIAALPSSQAGTAGGVVNTFRQLGFAVGTALFGTVFANGVTASLAGSGEFSASRATDVLQGGATHEVIASAAPGDRAGIAHAIREAFALGVDHVHLIGAISAVVAAVLVLFLVRRTRQQAEPAPARAEPSAVTPDPAQ